LKFKLVLISFIFFGIIFSATNTLGDYYCSGNYCFFNCKACVLCTGACVCSGTSCTVTAGCYGSSQSCSYKSCSGSYSPCGTCGCTYVGSGTCPSNVCAGGCTNCGSGYSCANVCVLHNAACSGSGCGSNSNCGSGNYCSGSSCIPETGTTSCGAACSDCSGGSCVSKTCALGNNYGCASGNYCNSSASCIATLANGASCSDCSLNGECTSGNCGNGGATVCCDSGYRCCSSDADCLTGYKCSSYKCVLASPQWSNNKSSITSPYSTSPVSSFNVTWTQPTYGVSMAFIEGNWSGGPQNYTMTQIVTDVYNYNNTLPVGTFYWKSYANSTVNFWNSSNSMNFTISQNTTNPIDIYLINSTGTYKNQNITAAYGISSTANSTAVYSNSGTANLYEDGSSVSNPRTFTLSLGLHSYKGNITGNNNYTSNATGATYNITVIDRTPPTWQNQGTNDTDNQILQGKVINLTAQGKDDAALNWAWLATNESGIWQNKTVYGSPMNMNNVANLWVWSNFTWQNSSVTNGTIVAWIIYYNDTSNNQNATDIATFLVGTSPSFMNVTLNVTKVWWQDIISVSGYTNVSQTVTVFLNNSQICSTTSALSGFWSCTFSAPTLIGTYGVFARSLNATSTTKNINVFPYYGTQGIGSTPRVVYEVPFLIQDLNGQVQRIIVRIAVSK